jgi:hypothetical protein
VGRIRPEAEGLLGAAAYCGSRPSWPHDSTGAAQQPLGSVGSGAARHARTACGHRAVATRAAAGCHDRRRPTGRQGVGKPAGTAHAGKGEGVGQGGTGVDAMRRRCDDGAARSAQDGSVPVEGRLR